MADSVSDAQVQQFSSITGAPPRLAAQFLAASGGDLNSALASYYAAQEDNVDDPANDSDYIDEPEPASRPAGGHRLDDPSSAQPATAPTSSRSNKPQPQKKFATLNDFSSGANNDDDDDDDEKQDLFAGGEKSGLAVQNPDDLKKRILEKAQRSGPPPSDEPSKKSFFKGAAHTLGSDETPSQEIPAAPEPIAPPERVQRTLHFWTDGFSVDDGDLYRSDDPRNAELLELIRRGRAPLRIMNVAPGQEVDVEIKEHKEKYVKPKKQYKPFEGSGNRLGSPTPAMGGTQTMPGAFEPAAAAATPVAASANSSHNGVDESQPTITLRVSLGTGTRLTSRFNTTQTVGDLYDFVRRSEPGGREFVMQTTFPSIELKDLDQVLGEMPEFKRGGAVVQKYV
jgi:UBX domain-containing protein 1